MKATNYIPRENFNLWYRIFKQSSGRFLHNPVIEGKRVYVSYMFEDMDSYTQMNLLYSRLTTPIKETKRSVWKTWRARYLKHLQTN